MKVMSYQDFSHLPDEIKHLVSEGVYSLYQIQLATAKFLLVTNRNEFYFLADDGIVVQNPGFTSIRDVHVVDAISLKGTDGARHWSSRINFA